MESYTSLSKKLIKLLNNAVDEYVFPGVVVGIQSKHGRIIIPVGKQTYSQNAQRIDEDSIYDVASITKTVPTSLLALKLIENDSLSLDQKVYECLPEFSGKWKKDVTVFHLLTQSVDFGLQLSLLKNKKPEEILHYIFTCDLKVKPGTTYAYANSTSIVLGHLLESTSGKRLSTLAEELLFEPLSMNNSTFYPTKFQKERIVPTEIDPWRGREIRGEVHDESAFVLSQVSPVGSAGLFTCTSDLLNVLEMLYNGGKYNKKQVFLPDTVAQMTMNQLMDIGQKAALGWQMDNEFMGTNHPSGMIGKTGFTGCCMVYDPKYNIGIVMLSNYHYPKRKSNNDSLNEVRRSVIETTIQSLL